MVTSNRFFQKSVFICLAMAFMTLTCPVSAAEVMPAQKQKLDQINELIARVSAEGLAGQQKVEIISEILRMTPEPADEARVAGNTELAEKTVEIVDKMASALYHALEAMPDPKSPGILQTALEAAETASAATLSIAEMARETQNSKLGQDAMSAVMNLKQVFHILKIAAQYVIHSGEDAETVRTAEILFGKIGQTERINQNAFDAAVAAGAKPPKQPGSDTEQPPGWWKYKDLPLDDQRTASGM